MVSIHPTAIVEDGARLGKGVVVGPYCHIESETRIGDGCRLDAHAIVRAYTEIGPGCTLHSHVTLGDVPQDFSFSLDTRSRLVVGAGCTFREGFTAHRGTREGTDTIIGDHVYCMAHSHVAHNCHVGDRAMLANGALLGGHVTIGPQAFISGNCVVHQFCRVGRLAMISGLGAMSQDLPPFCLAHSTDTNKISGVNVVGMRRAGMDAEARGAVKRAFRAIYVTRSTTREAIVETVSRGQTHPAVQEMLDFIAASTRGIGVYRRRRDPKVREDLVAARHAWEGA